jgi:hypothetical protein
MAVTHGTAMRTALAAAVKAAAEAGANNPRITLYDATTSPTLCVATCALSSVASFGFTVPTFPVNKNATKTGTVDHYCLEDAAGTEIVRGAAGDTGIPAATVSGQPVAFQSFAYTAPV